MKGIFLSFLGGAFLTLQGVANSQISRDLSTWQVATITQFTGFIIAGLILIMIRKGDSLELKKVKPLYLSGGTFAAVIIFSNITAYKQIGVTFSVSALLLAQLSLSFVIDSKGWFGVTKQKMQLPQFIGLGLMMAGIILLAL
ncbi:MULTISPECIES: DMT family transporter [Peribacillus]|uniref:DMT family transporter n=1 Tax=Peribacillus TaxID=2675229 RepID=UPI00203CA723|nr:MULTISPECIES: DMT family transporter [Peribacillus]MCM3676305.1 DMT family transporter [Peribacillus simplex]MDQ0879395.1 transporter family-2 protein [Peribacillus sp. V2I11]